MPLHSGTVTAPVPPPTAPGIRGRATATWIAPDGSAWPLTTPEIGWYTPRGVSGLDAAPIELTTDAHPRGGARVRHRQPQPRLIVWPIQVHGRSAEEFTARWRALAEAFGMTDRLGPGRLQVSRPGGPRREIAAHYQDGFDDALGLRADGLAAITLYCEDPYWLAIEATSIRREHGVGVDFLDPYPSVSSSQVLGATTLHNPGEIVAWPEWVITGPASEVVATLTATGESWTLTPADISATLHPHDQVRVSTDPPRVRYHAAETQTIDLGSATAGTITITFDGHETAPIGYDADAEDVQAALETLSNIHPGDVAVSGGPLPAEISLQFPGRYLAVDVPEVTVTPAGLTGGAVTVTTVRDGGVANWVGALNFPDAILWGLPPGSSAVDFAVGGAVAGTSITASFFPRYRTS